MSTEEQRKEEEGTALRERVAAAERELSSAQTALAEASGVGSPAEELITRRYGYAKGGTTK